MTSTESRVLLSSSGDAARALLRKWGEWCASNGGRFSVTQEYSGNWNSGAAVGRRLE